MKQIQHITTTLALASLIALNLSGCSTQDEPVAADTEKGIAIESITATMQGMESNEGAATRATGPQTQTKEGFSVNVVGTDPTNPTDPTYTRPEARTNWKMDLALYSKTGDNTYASDASISFTGNTYSSSNNWTAGTQYYFPNYLRPKVDVIIYPTEKNTTIETEQNTRTHLLNQDILINSDATISVAHILNVAVKHKHSMLDFVIKDVNREDIIKNSSSNTTDEVTVSVAEQTYTPYRVTTETTGIGDIEYMLILSEETTENPIVHIKTKVGTNSSAITYKQTIKIIGSKNKNNRTITKLGSNNCYCFTLQGSELKISPVTVLNWATGESLPGEYIAVTAYPTFKAEGHAGETFYFYYDNKLMEGDNAKLQKITFNENAECTIKPDGRILTHIFTKPDGIPSDTNKLATSITLGAMVVNVANAISISSGQ